MAINDVFRMTIKGTVAGQDHYLTHHFRDLTGAAAQTAIITVWQATCRTALRGCFTTADTPLLSYEVRQVCGTLPLQAPGAATEPGATQAGTISPPGERLASWLARVISWRTAYAGRSYRGRSFFGGLYEDWCNGNNVNGAQMTQTDAYVTAMLGAFGPSGSSADWRLVVWSERLRDLGNSCLLSSAGIDAGLSQQAIASMKSRKVGHGN